MGDSGPLTLSSRVPVTGGLPLGAWERCPDLEMTVSEPLSSGRGTEPLLWGEGGTIKRLWLGPVCSRWLIKYGPWGEREVTVAPWGIGYLLQPGCPAVGSPLLTLSLQHEAMVDLGLAWDTQPPAYGLKKATVSGPPRHQSQARPGLPAMTHLYSSLIKSRRAEGLS